MSWPCSRSKSKGETVDGTGRGCVNGKKPCFERLLVGGVFGGLGKPELVMRCLTAFDLTGIGMGPRVGETGLSISSACSLRVIGVFVSGCV